MTDPPPPPLDIQFSVIHRALLVTVLKYKIPRKKFVSSLRLTHFQLWLMDDTFHTNSLFGTMQESLLKCPLHEIALQELCHSLSPQPSARIPIMTCSHHPSSQPGFSLITCSPHLALKPIFFIM